MRRANVHVFLFLASMLGRLHGLEMKCSLNPLLHVRIIVDFDLRVS